MANHHILMADVIATHQYGGNDLSQSLSKLVSSCNRTFAARILSPYTITLGDEFQGVAASLGSAVEAIFYVEEYRLDEKLKFKLRYALCYGEIESELNPKIAHGMLGSGLSEARKMLNGRKIGNSRFRFKLDDKRKSKQLTRLFRLIESVVSKWKERDYPLISEMLTNDNDQQVGLKFNKNRSQIWKRRKNLRIEEYLTLKKIILDLIN